MKRISGAQGLTGSLLKAKDKPTHLDQGAASRGDQ